MKQSEFLTEAELLELGFSKVGRNCRISRKSSFYRISGQIGDETRIDDFCILKGHVDLGSHVHIAAFCSVSGAWDKVTIGDFVSLSNRVSIFTGSDNYSETALNNTDAEPICGPVSIGLSVLVGAHSVILPGVSIGDAASVGANATIVKSIEPGAITKSTAIAVTSERKRDVEKMRRLAKEWIETSVTA